MSHDHDIPILPLATIARRCQEESEAFFHYLPHDARFCYEMFRRAMVERVEYAWTLLYAQYNQLVTRWVERTPGFAATGEEAAYFVNRAFHKMWSAFSPDKFREFPDLKSLLRYLQMCVNSAMVDHMRAQAHQLDARRSVRADLNDDAEKVGAKGQGDNFFQELARQEFWELIQQRLKGAREERVIYCRFILDLKPAAICARFPDDFPDVKEIYLLLQNILVRLRRDPDLKKFFGEDA